MNHLVSILRLSAILTAFGLTSYGADPFAEGVRTTDPLSPQEQQQAFHVPPGFEIKLFAAEPDLAKPMNMAFDEQGRLWVTDSLEYPFAAPLDQPGRDTIKILEDTDGDGRADKITTFADGLNIPIGIYPYKGGAIAWSIPNIWHFKDTNGDGKADERVKLYGPLGWERDTHGMNSSFTRGFDGWLYATHGFNNHSTIRGADGSELQLHSGNTYRIQLDGSRVEPFTWGQVNPFGMCLDPQGNLYTADCHSSPIYQLIRGAYYPSFGKPHDGLGFAPVLMQHTHGSTAIAGIVFYANGSWPAEFHNNIFVGNVMTSRVNRDQISFHGSSPNAAEMPDLVRSDDPWFRPMNLQLGPDEALYIADFYNRIIGHYEVPLQHPGRDRFRGRIWRLAYTGTNSSVQAVPALNQATPLKRQQPATIDELISQLSSPNLTVRLTSMNQLVDNHGAASIRPVQRLLLSKATDTQTAHGIWVLHRLNALSEELLSKAAAHEKPLVRIHAMRVLSEIADWAEVYRNMALAGLRDSDASVKRAAADALGQHPHASHILPMLEFRLQMTPADDHLLHAARISLRNQFRASDAFEALPKELSLAQWNAVADVCLGLSTPEAAAFLVDYLLGPGAPANRLSEYVQHAARYAPSHKIEELAGFAQDHFATDPGLQLAAFDSITKGTAQRGDPLIPAVRQWGAKLAAKLLATADAHELTWQFVPHKTGGAEAVNPWSWEKRRSSDNPIPATFLSSFPKGEQVTGILRSRTFSIPAKLQFFLAGQSGFPNTDDPMRNFFRLRHAETGEIIAESPVPRDDIAQKYEWDLQKYAGGRGYLEAVDGDDGKSWAWIAFARIEPAVVPMPEIAPSEAQQLLERGLQLVRDLQLNELQSEVFNMLNENTMALSTRVAAARTLASLHPEAALPHLADWVRDGNQAVPVRQAAAEVLAEINLESAHSILMDAVSAAPHRVQRVLAGAWLSNRSGASKLVEAIEQGKASAWLLTDNTIQERLKAASVENLAERIKALTANLPPADNNLQKLIDQRRAELDLAKADLERGKVLFDQACAVCHQIDGKGALVGPQLDGIGLRGPERLIEDILDPDRNVDAAFQTLTITLEDGEVISGLLRREEGKLLILANAAGAEVAIDKDQIQERHESKRSLMPANFGELFTSDDLRDLAAFLLSDGKVQNAR